MHWSQFGYRPPMGARRIMARRAAREMGRSRGLLRPVEIHGKKIAETWWGTSWNRNLERYADYSNRIGRGRSYVRNGLVIDLQVAGGMVDALVAGSSPYPYEVTIHISPISAAKNRKLIALSTASIESVQDLLNGTFPENLKTLLFSRETGLFPQPKEISFQCTCPDSAIMCKHVAAVLYGIGNRVDSKPELFFILRNIDPKKFAGSAARIKSRDLISRKHKASSRIFESADIASIFELEVTKSGSKQKKSASRSILGRRQKTWGKKKKRPASGR